jgi:hypothetical protein
MVENLHPIRTRETRINHVSVPRRADLLPVRARRSRSVREFQYRALVLGGDQ